MIERTIDRYLKRTEAAAKKAAPKRHGLDDDSEQNAADPAKLLNPQMVMSVTGKAAETMTQTNYRGGLWRTHKIAWSNLPILNYLRSRYPDREPMDVYAKLFGQTLVEPTGGEYLWNEQQATYYSSHHGYHLDPQAGPILANTFGTNDSVRTTFSFQDNGIRATMKVTDRE